MRARQLSDIAAVTRGRVAGGDVTVTGVTTSSTSVRPGDLFVALPGERVDGHDFVGDALAAGAAAALVGDAAAFEPLVIVEDPRSALLDLARHERATLPATVVGITGSVGKTSVKDLTAAVLAARFRVVASPASYNTEVGVPLTILAADEGTEVIVCEMGSRGLGHITLLCDVARPSVGVVTSVGAAHLEMFRSLDVVADAKAELPEALPEDGTAVLNDDDPVVRGFETRTRARVVRYGTSGRSDVRAEDLVLDERGLATFTLHADGSTERVELSIPGEHMASNALAAAGVGVALGVSPAEASAALKEASVAPWRMETFETSTGVRVVNDAYNANPMSMAAALKAAAAIRGAGRCVAVLGEMAELGEAADGEHERVGELVARLGIDRLVVVGEAARLIAVAAVREGVEPEHVAGVDTDAEALEALRAWVRPGDVVLVKASRRAELDRLAEALRESNG